MQHFHSVAHTQNYEEHCEVCLTAGGKAPNGKAPNRPFANNYAFGIKAMQY